MRRVCEQAQMTVQNYYARRTKRNQHEVDVRLLLQLVRAERRVQSRLGVRKLYHMISPELREAGVKMGRDRFFEELRKAGLLVEPKRSQWPKTTHFDVNLAVFRNRIKKLKLTGRNQVWIADITYIRTEEGFMYLGLITDKWSRKIVGFYLGDSLEAASVLKALRMAIKGLKRGEKPIHHSDRGCQYCCHEYVKLLQEWELPISMTEELHCYENAVAERVNGILKQEYELDRDFRSKAEARQAVEQAVYLYNHRRPHLALGYQVPEQVYQTAA